MRDGLALPIAALALTVTLTLIGCRHTIDPPEAAVAGLREDAPVYTLTNLHAEEEKVSAANFQYPDVIPVCSRVTLLGARKDYLEFRVEETGREYWYQNHGAVGEPFADHLARYFGPLCPKAELAALTDAERDAIRAGIVRTGMSKEAVILAIGYPPKRDTRTTELPRWRYWTGSRADFIVVFGDDGRVAEVVTP